MNKKIKILNRVLMILVLALSFGSCSKDEDAETSSIDREIIGTWINNDTPAGSFDYDNLTLVFNADNTGSVRNDWGIVVSEIEESDEMRFNWSVATASDGSYQLTIKYASGNSDTRPFDTGRGNWTGKVELTNNSLKLYVKDYINKREEIVFKRK